MRCVRGPSGVRCCTVVKRSILREFQPPGLTQVRASRTDGLNHTPWYQLSGRMTRLRYRTVTQPIS